MTGATVVPHYRLVLAREQRKLRQEQAIIEACERELDLGAKSVDEVIRGAKARLERERRP